MFEEIWPIKSNSLSKLRKVSLMITSFSISFHTLETTLRDKNLIQWPSKRTTSNVEVGAMSLYAYVILGVQLFPQCISAVIFMKCSRINYVGVENTPISKETKISSVHRVYFLLPTGGWGRNKKGSPFYIRNRFIRNFDTERAFFQYLRKIFNKKQKN